MNKILNTVLSVLLTLLLIFTIVYAQTGTYTTHGLFYLPKYGASGVTEYNEYNDYMEIADQQIWANKEAIEAIEIPDLDGYVLINDIDSETELETLLTDVTDVYTNNDFDIADYALTTDLSGFITGLSTFDTDDLTEGLLNLYFPGFTSLFDDYAFTDNSSDWDTAYGWGNHSTQGYLKNITNENFASLKDIPAHPAANNKILETVADGTYKYIDTPSGGAGATTYLDLTDTPAAYDNGKYAKSTAAGVVWDTPTGSGDMLKSTYDADADGDIDVAAGGTEKSSWTQYCIPYLSGTTAFGEIAIGTAAQLLKVNATANGYEWFTPSYLTDITGQTFASLSDIPAHPGVANKILETTAGGYIYIDTPSGGGGASELSDLSDVNTSTPTNRNVLVADGVDWESRALVEADISDLGTYLENVVEDTTPQLGGNLDATDKNITGIGRASFTQEYDNGSKSANFTIDFATDQKQKVTLTANTMTLTLDTTSVGVANYLLKIVNGGLATLTWAAETGSVYWPGGTEPTLTSSGTDIVALYFDGTNWYCQASLDFK